MEMLTSFLCLLLLPALLHLEGCFPWLSLTSLAVPPVLDELPISVSLTEPSAGINKAICLSVIGDACKFCS